MILIDRFGKLSTARWFVGFMLALMRLLGLFLGERWLLAGVLVSMLAHVASHRAGFEGYDIHADDLRRSMARIVYTSVTGTKAP